MFRFSCGLKALQLCLIVASGECMLDGVGRVLDCKVFAPEVQPPYI